MANRKVKDFLNDPDGPISPGVTPARTSQPVKIDTTTRPRAASIVSNGGSSSYSTSPSILSRTVSGSSAGSTAPSLGGNGGQTLDEQIANMTIQQTMHLPCLLHDIIRCPVFFEIHEEELWIRHSITHFGRAGPPNYSICIFCPKTFDSSDANKSWRKRMRHINEHIQGGLHLGQSRPDFEVLHDLRRKGGISEEDYRWALRGTERPPVSGLRPLTYVPESILEAGRADTRAANRYVVTDDRRSKRHRRP